MPIERIARTQKTSRKYNRMSNNDVIYITHTHTHIYIQPRVFSYQNKFNLTKMNIKKKAQPKKEIKIIYIK